MRKIPNVDVKTALYIRVSTEEQAREGYSVSAQKERLIQYARKHELAVVDVYEDAGFTARKNMMKRPEFVRMLNDVQAGKIDLILFIKLDRWFRSVQDFYKIQEILDKHKVAWKTTEEDYDTATTSGRLNLNIRLAIAQDEADRTSDRIKFVFEQKIRMGEVITWSLPRGYKADGKKMVIDEVNAPLIQDLFDFYELYQSYPLTVKAIQEKYGITIYCGNLKGMLTNRFYIGEYRENLNFCDPIISRDQFDRVAEILNKRSVRWNPSGKIYIFTGLIVCTHCGRNYTSAYTRNIYNNVYTYYRCPNKVQQHKCNSNNVNESVLEEYLLSNVENLIDREMHAEIKKVKVIKKNDNANIMKKLDRLNELFVNGYITLHKYESDRKELLSQLVEEKKDPATDFEYIKSKLTGNIREIYQNLDRQGKQAFWRGLVKKIEIIDRDQFKVFF